MTILLERSVKAVLCEGLHRGRGAFAVGAELQTGINDSADARPRICKVGPDFSGFRISITVNGFTLDFCAGA